jgi:hypothetical protein
MAHLKNVEGGYNLLMTLVCGSREVGALVQQLEFGGRLAVIHGHNDIQKTPVSALFVRKTICAENVLHLEILEPLFDHLRQFIFRPPFAIALITKIIDDCLDFLYPGHHHVPGGLTDSHLLWTCHELHGTPD